MHNTGIYEIRNLVNGKRYVGSAVRFCNRWRVHTQSLARGDHHSKQLQRSWLKYGPFAFQFNKLLVCEKKDLLMYEQICIDLYKPEYNSAPKAGSNLGLKMRDESKAKLAEAARRTKNFTGKKHSEESRAKISASRKGKSSGPMTEERRAKIGASQKGKVITQEQRAKISAKLLGHKQTSEQIAKRVEKLRGRKMPEGFSKSASDRMTGMKCSPNHCMNIGKAKASLSDAQVVEIRERKANERITQKQLAKEYQVDPSVISELLARKTYAWVV